jgi:hypothetical protein
MEIPDLHACDKREVTNEHSQDNEGSGKSARKRNQYPLKTRFYRGDRCNRKDTIFSMIGRGAEILPDEIEPMSVFLAATSARSGPASAQGTQTGGRGRQAAGRPDQQTPETEGRAILQRTCQQCHDMATATTKVPSEEWSAVIAKMVGYGARLTPADQQKLTEDPNTPSTIAAAAKNVTRCFPDISPPTSL